jgi:uncharacterized RDD family membrane protein YckC
MRCPKCHYISFDSGQRCRNCGYDFSLSVDVAASAPDLPISTPNTPEGPLADFALETARPVPPRAPDTASDLPLFSRALSDRPRVATPPVVPRPPLAVRRSAPAPPRDRSRFPLEPTLDLGTPERAVATQPVPPPPTEPAEPEGPRTASLVGRTAAGFIDVVLMGSIHAAVIYLTLRLCGLATAELQVLPPIPLAAFLLMLTSGYIISFTVAGGQTIGKMAAGIRVVPIAGHDPGNARLTLGRAVLRAAGCLVSLLTAGLGYIPALVSQDHRALHDRLADTRVVRA